MDHAIQSAGSPLQTGSAWMGSLLASHLPALHQGPGLLLLALMAVAGFLGTAGCLFTLPTMMRVVGESSPDARKKGLILGALFSGGMLSGMILLGSLAGRASGLLQGPVRGLWTLVMVGLALFLGIWILRGGSPAPSLFPARPGSFRFSGRIRPGMSGAFFAGLLYSAGPPLVSLLFVFGLGFAPSTPAFGALLGFSFGLGRSLPFLLTGWAADPLSRAGCRIGGRRWLRFAGASILFFVGGYYLWLAKPFLETLS